MVNFIQTDTLCGVICHYQPIHDKATNYLWIACCRWNPSFGAYMFTFSLKAMNHKNVTNMVWRCFSGLINECSYSRSGKSHTDRLEDFCLALEWRKDSSCVSWHWALLGWLICRQAAPLMWTWNFTLKSLLSLTIQAMCKNITTKHSGWLRLGHLKPSKKSDYLIIVSATRLCQYRVCLFDHTYHN